MPSLRSLRSFFVVCAAAFAAACGWAAEVPFSQGAFDAALAQGRPVIVDFAADWCPTCKAQKPVVQSLLGEAKREQIGRASCRERV